MTQLNYLTSNFRRDEVECKCGQCTGLPTNPMELRYFMEELMWLQDIRSEYGRPMVLSSGYRCPDHNDRVSSTGRNGPHTRGAFDIVVHGNAAAGLLGVALPLGARGIGVSQKGPHNKRFIHLDRLLEEDRTRPWVWSY